MGVLGTMEIGQMDSWPIKSPIAQSRCARRCNWSSPESRSPVVRPRRQIATFTEKTRQSEPDSPSPTVRARQSSRYQSTQRSNRTLDLTWLYQPENSVFVSQHLEPEGSNMSWQAQLSLKLPFRS